MNFKKFFYMMVLSLGLVSVGIAAGNPQALIRDNDKDIVLVYADGTINPAVSRIVLTMSLKGMWGDRGADLINSIKTAAEPTDRIRAIINNKDVANWTGVQTEIFNDLRRLYRPAPAVAPRRPANGAPVRAEEPRQKRGIGFPGGEAIKIDEEDLNKSRGVAATIVQSGYRGMKARQEARRLRGEKPTYPFADVEKYDASMEEEEEEESRPEEELRQAGMSPSRRQRSLLPRDTHLWSEAAEQHYQKIKKRRALGARDAPEINSLKSYSEAKGYWMTNIAPTIKKKLFESDKRYNHRLYDQMLTDLQNKFPEQVEAEESMRYRSH